MGKDLLEREPAMGISMDREKCCADCDEKDKELKDLQENHDILEQTLHDTRKELADFKEGHRRRVDENFVLGCNYRTVSDKYESLKELVGALEKKYREKSNKELSMCHSDLAVVILDELKQAVERKEE